MTLAPEAPSVLPYHGLGAFAPSVVEAIPAASDAPAEARLSPKQLRSIYEALLVPNAFGEKPKVCLWDGAVRSGKTIASLFAWCLYVAAYKGSGDLVVIGRTRESIGRNVFGPLTDPDLFGPFARLIKYTVGAPTATMFGRTVHVLGASDVRSETVLRGLTCGGAYCDELTLINEAFFTQLLARMSVFGAQCFATTNPDSPGHYVKKSIIDKKRDLGYRRFQFAITDNEHLMATNPGYVDQLLREFTGLSRRRFIDGDWVQAEGAVYELWDPDKHMVDPKAIPKMEQVLMCGIDFGTIHPTRGYLLGLGRRPRPDIGDGASTYCLYVLEEWAPPKNLAPSDQVRLLEAWLTLVSERWGAPKWVAIDPAASHFRAEVFRNGRRNLMKAANKVNPGIMTVTSLLATGQMLVSKTCTVLEEKLPGYMWDPKQVKLGLEEPLKENDDEADALRYTVYSSRRFWAGKIRVTAAMDDAPGVDSED